jgi:hypothetical protein
MVLNSLAILFLNELDDKVGTDKDLFRKAKDIVEKLGWLNSDGKEQDEVDTNVETHEDDEVFVTSKRLVKVTTEKEEKHSSSIECYQIECLYSSRISDSYYTIYLCSCLCRGDMRSVLHGCMLWQHQEK